MKYSRLTKEQFEELHQEFSRFLATQSINAEEWTKIKQDRPELAAQELDLFSDLVWEKVLSQAQYLQNSSPQQLFLFKIEEEGMRLIRIKLNDSSIDLTTHDGISWLGNHIMSDTVELFEGEKKYAKPRNEEVFNLIQQGAEIVNGDNYELLASQIED